MKILTLILIIPVLLQRKDFWRLYITVKGFLRPGTDPNQVEEKLTRIIHLPKTGYIGLSALPDYNLPQKQAGEANCRYMCLVSHTSWWS